VTEGAAARLRPLALGEVLDVAIKICIANWRTLLRAVLVVVVPVEILSTALTADSTRSSFDFSTTTTPAQSTDDFNGELGGLAISTLLQVVAVIVVYAACFRIIAEAYLGGEVDWRSSLRFARHHALGLLWVIALTIVLIMLGFLLFIVGAIWLGIAFTLAPPALFVEGLRGRRALGRSFRLVRGRWWRTCAVISVGFFLAAVVSGIVQAVFVAGVIAGAGNDALVLVFSAIAGTAGLAITTPFQAALITVVYFDLRVRKEGFDLELLAQEIGSGAPASDRAPAGLFAPVVQEVDRSKPPYWPPPPGWTPEVADEPDSAADQEER
jgi:hypothetical protein